MLKKMFLFSVVLSLLLLCIQSEDAAAQVNVSKAGRPWEIDGCAIPLDNNNESYDHQCIALRGDSDKYIVVTPGSGAGWNVYERGGRSSSVNSPAIQKSFLFREFLPVMFYLVF